MSTLSRALSAQQLRRCKQQTIDSYEAFLAGGPAPRWPLEVFLEVSNVCDLRCAMCDTFSGLSERRLVCLAEAERGFFAPGGSHPPLEGLLRHALWVHAFGYGEPTVHPRFVELLGWLGGLGVMVDLFTHGMHLDERLCERLVATRVAGITVSLSGATAADYEAVYLGGRYQRVLDGIERLARWRQRARSSYPQITINSIAFGHHVARLPEFVDRMAGCGVDVIEVKRLVPSIPALADHAAVYRPEVEGEQLAEAQRRAKRHGIVLSAVQYEQEAPDREPVAPVIPLSEIQAAAREVEPSRPSGEPPSTPPHAMSGDAAALLASRPLDELEARVPRPFHCLEPFKTLYVRRGGLVKPCCFAVNCFGALGSVDQAEGVEIWRGAGFRALREDVAHERYPQSCEHCLRHGLAPLPSDVSAGVRTYAAWYAETRGARLRLRGRPATSAQRLLAERWRRR